MIDHSDLVAEINQVEKMTTPERLKHAKKRRAQQLKAFANYEKQLEKDKNKKNKQSQSQKQRSNRKKGGVRFIHNIMLLEAAARNDIEEVRKLLMSGVSPNVTNEDGLTALHQCCIDDSEVMLKLLMEFGANVNSRDSEMWTPLHAAATCGHVHLCKLLIEKGAELLAVNADGNMPYDICEEDVCLDFIETEMAKRGITQEEIDEKRLETERKMLKDLKRIAAEKGNLEYRDKNWATPLHVAAANGYLEVVDFLLNEHVSLEVRDEDGWLPIHAAACWLQPEVIDLLVKNGCDIDAKTRTGDTPFDLAEDPDVKQKILDLKDEMESHRASKSKDHIRNRRPINTRGSSTNSSLKHSLNTPSASIRRTSMRNEKKPLFRKEAQEEAKHFGMISNDQEALDLIDDDELIPSTSIDDVNISIIDDISEKHQRESPEKNKVSKTDFSKPDKVVSPSTEKQKVDKTDTSKPDKALSPSTEKQKINKTDSAKPDKAISPSNKNTKVVQSKESPNAKNASPDNRRAQSQSMTHKNHSSDSEKQRSDPPGKTDHKTEHNREPIHVQMGHADSGGKSLQMEDKQKDSLSKPSPGGQDETSPPSGTAGNPQLRHLQTEGEGKPVVRTASFQKKRESQRLRSLENHLATTAEGDESGRYTSGTNTGTLADLKKQRLEQHKFGSGTEGMVANLFLTSLSTDPRKYSSGTPSSTSAPPSKDKVQNGRSPRSNNNNNNNGQSRPPTFISDNGPLRRFSAPASAPVIGEDDKFKNDCCVIL